MTSKKYILCVASVLYAFMIINLILWHGVVGHVFMLGEFSRIGSTVFPEPLTEYIHYSQHHAEFANYAASGLKESFDVLTIGDSFTNGKDGGSYPDCLVNNYGLKVLNVRLTNYDPVQTLYILNESGWLDEISPSVVILESVERSAQKRLGGKIVIPLKMGADDVKHLLRIPLSDENLSYGLMPAVMIQANMKYLTNKLHHLRNPEELSPEACITKLERNFFTNTGYENTLLFLAEDLEYLTEPLNAEIMNQNLNNAANLLKAKGIKLLFFAGVDKYDLYYPYIIDKKGRPENPFFHKIRELQGKDYVFVDSMKLLREALERGEQDVYWLNDTHWSHKGIKLVCDELVKYILPESR